MIDRAYILPTGDELIEGIILDTDSPMIAQTLLQINPNCRITRLPPIPDRQERILSEIKTCSGEGADLIILIGGSGGGHRYSSTLGKDFTHSGLDELLPEGCGTSLYGKNGHLWSRLVCGFYGETLLINVPGPYREAAAAIRAFQETAAIDGLSPEKINARMAQAVEEQYGCVFSED